MREDELYGLKAFLERSKNRREILELLSKKQQPMKPTEIGKELKVQRTTISKRIMNLERKGLVKVLNPEDNRNRYYKITEKGKELLKHL